MLEFMDNVSIRAVEADLRMGLDTSAGAMLLAQSDLTGPDRAAETEFMAEAFRTHGASEVFATDDPEEGEQFTVARRAAFTSLGKTGTLLLEDVGVPLPALPELVAGIEEISAGVMCRSPWSPTPVTATRTRSSCWPTTTRTAPTGPRRRSVR